ncbi:aspartate-semialdehyde dehydrogenase [Aerococcus urinaehominis]|uniref:Aspartate-semialdehyde dehydrogenase n=1 Tax=Aerococcus urinaehominis TaxID=128944 RepID=A0A0X8FKH9_9LACT|nr:aspartate-semialdehyde dehydrogenase [Aerococcus urinaehominis]AMB98984.1 aspartate-semialdehyde dehydrogenase [Aerococcus urinaehominis]SDM37903.1 aspartate-semialdehyde dehydrogenase [Aerococcus urinaehominis]
MSKAYNVAIVGATGAVGEQLRELLTDVNFQLGEIRLLASARSAGRKLNVGDQEIEVQELTHDSFDGIDIAFFSAGGDRTKEFGQSAIDAGAIVVDNTSAFRMDPETPLVVPEVNPDQLKNNKGLIANPNCSTIQMVAALKPIYDKFGISRVIASTYQAVSGAGLHAIEEMLNQYKAILAGEEIDAPQYLPVGGDKKHYQMAFNVLPQIDKFQDNHYTFEEMKMTNETKKILGDDQVAVSTTAVRVPVIKGHSESVYIEVKEDGVTIEDIMAVLKDAPGIVLEDDIDNQVYPQPIKAASERGTFVGRIRQDLDFERGFHMWIVSDNLWKGAALNSIQIAESLVDQGLV